MFSIEFETNSSDKSLETNSSDLSLETNSSDLSLETNSSDKSQVIRVNLKFENDDGMDLTFTTSDIHAIQNINLDGESGEINFTEMPISTCYECSIDWSPTFITFTYALYDRDCSDLIIKLPLTKPLLLSFKKALSEWSKI